jgi:Lar family restriction alleviation protein
MVKPCPFCGEKKPELVDAYTVHASTVHAWYVECISCDVSTMEYSTVEEALAAWNRRAKDGR